MSSSSIKDVGSITRAIFDYPTNSSRVLGVGGTLVPDKYDSIALTYIPSGNGAGQVGTVTYSLASAPIATLTLTYDASNRVINVARS
jgi:hypothetical protein